MKYRPEIDGIRAIAVLAVIFYHIESSWLPGGFLGVDVFFVLSGFLITSILSDQFEQGISLKSFWIKRSRRILPPLLGVVSFSLFIGAAFFLQHDRIMLLKHAVAAIASLSNFFIWENTKGYWAISSETLPLLHTWSLSVEEQFYLFFPLLLFFLNRWNSQRVLIYLGGLTCFSLYLTWQYDDNHVAVFLMLPFRAWEMFFGAMLAIALRGNMLPFTTSTSLHSVVQFMALITLGYAFITTEVRYLYQGILPLIACSATTVLIYSLSCKTLINKILSHTVFVYVGKRSYSLYLYHWPIIVFLKLYTPHPRVWLVLCLSFLCAELSYQLIEKPFRYQARPFRQVRNWIMVSLLPLGFAAVAASSYPFAVSRDLYSLSLPGVNDRGEHNDIPDVAQGLIIEPRSWNWNGIDRPQILLAGSSHASSMVAGLAEYCLTNNFSLVTLPRSHEGIVEDSIFNEARLKFAQKHSPQTVILFSHWTREIKDQGLIKYQEAIRKWTQVCVYLIVVDSPPQIKIPSKIAHSLHHYLVHLDITGQPLLLDVLPRDTHQLSADINTMPNISWVGLMPLFSVDGKCRFLPDGSIPYADLYHINILGVRFLLQEKLGSLLEQSLKNRPNIDSD